MFAAMSVGIVCSIDFFVVVSHIHPSLGGSGGGGSFPGLLSLSSSLLLLLLLLLFPFVVVPLLSSSVFCDKDISSLFPASDKQILKTVSVSRRPIPSPPTNRKTDEQVTQIGRNEIESNQKNVKYLQPLTENLNFVPFFPV